MGLSGAERQQRVLRLVRHADAPRKGGQMNRSDPLEVSRNIFQSIPRSQSRVAAITHGVKQLVKPEQSQIIQPRPDEKETTLTKRTNRLFEERKIGG